MSLTVNRLPIDGVLEIVPPKFGDERGFFSETFNAGSLLAAGIDLPWVQDNHSYSAPAGVLRGLHYQLPPAAQDKLVRVIRGRIFDVAVDIRRGSPTFGRWCGLEISARKWNQILVPKGFAHGFLTLEPDTEVIYKVSAPYSKEHDRGICFDDPSLDIDWPAVGSPLTLSDKDRAAPMLKDADNAFTFGE